MKFNSNSIALSLFLFSLTGARPAQAGAMLGAYVDWKSPSGRESGVQQFETWLGHPIELALDYTDGSSWSGFASFKGSTTPDYWHQVAPHRNLIWSIALTLDGTPLSQVASGQYDSYFATVASSIAAAQPNAIIRLGWEMNGNWFAWSTAGVDQDYINAFRHVVGIFRKASGSFKYDWCPDIGNNNDAAENSYPGDDVVDIIGLDLYDGTGGTPEDRWNAMVSGGHGLQWHADFAAQHGKPISFPEFGVGQGGDNSYFIQQMSAWINNHNVVYSSYWNTNSAYPGLLSTGQYPAAAAMFKKVFPQNISSGSGPVSSPSPTPVSTSDPSWTFCANEGNFCSFAGAKTVRYGANGTYLTLGATDGINCSNSAFGQDPLYGVFKHCEISSAAAQVPAPAPAPAAQPAPGLANGSMVNLVNVGSQLCVDVPGASQASGTGLVQNTCGSGWWSEQFTATQNSDGTYSFMNRSSAQCLAVPNASMSSGIQLRQETCQSSAWSQRFQVKGSADGTSILVNLSSALCIDIQGASRTKGAKVQQYTCNGSDAQKFHF